MPKISALVLAFDYAETIKAAAESMPWTDEIVISKLARYSPLRDIEAAGTRAALASAVGRRVLRSLKANRTAI